MKLRIALCGIAAMAMAALASEAHAKTVVTLKFGSPTPAESFVTTRGMLPWVHEVEKASNGTLKIKVYSGPTLGTFRNIYDRTLNDVAQISLGVFGPYASLFPRTQVADLPFLSNNSRVSSMALWRLYAKGLITPEYGKVRVLALFNFPSAILNTNKPIRTVNDLKGVKLAVSSRTNAKVIAALGAAPVTLTPTEIYQGLSRGLAGGVAISWTAVRTFKLQEVTKDHIEVPLGQSPAFVFMNKKAYARLPAQAKRAIDRYSGESLSKRFGANNEAVSLAESKKVSHEPGQTVGQLSAAQYRLWEARIHPVITAWVKRTPDGAKVLATYRAEIKKIRAMN